MRCIVKPVFRELELSKNWRLCRFIYVPPTHKPSPLEAYLKGLKALSLAAGKPLSSEMVANYGLPESLPGDSSERDISVRADEFFALLGEAVEAMPEIEREILRATYFGSGDLQKRNQAAANALIGVARSSAPRNYSTKATRQLADELVRLANERQAVDGDPAVEGGFSGLLASRYGGFDERKVDQLGQLLVSSKTPFDEMDVSVELRPGPTEETLSFSVVEQFTANLNQIVVMHAIARDAISDEPNELAERVYAEWGRIMHAYWYMDKENLAASFTQQLENSRDLRVDAFRQNEAGHWIQEQLRKREMNTEEVSALATEWNVPTFDNESLRLLEVVLPDGDAGGRRRFRVSSKFTIEKRPKFCFWEFDRIAYVNSVRVKISELDETKFRVRFFGPSASRIVDSKARTWEFSVAGWCTRHNGINIHW